jgi:hypothetical protein
MFMWPSVVKLGKVVNQLDATKKEFYSVFLAHTNKTKHHIHTQSHHITHYTSTHITTTPNRTVLYLFSVLDIICCSLLYCTPDDGHIDARNMLS